MTRTGSDADPAGAETGAAVAFHGAHQAGIATPVQDRLHFASFDVKTAAAAAFVQMLKDRTAAARRMTAGHAVGGGRVRRTGRGARRTTPARPWASGRPG